MTKIASTHQTPLDDASTRFALLELDDAPLAAIEWDNAQATSEDIPVIEAVDDLYKGRFQGHENLDQVRERIPELVATVEKVPLYTADGAVMPGAFGTVRHMPNGTVQGLGVVGERYHVIQDFEAFKVMEPLMERGIIGTLTAGVYKAKSWLYGEAGAFKADIVPGDTIESRVLIGNSHDGSIPWTMGFPGNRVVCQNTFHHALSNALSKLMRIRHTKNASEVVQQVISAVDMFGMEFIESADKMRMLVKVPCTEETLKEYTGYVFSQWATSDEDEENTRTSRVYNKVLENFESGQGAQYSRGTLWGAYNSITEYVSHQRSRSENPNQVFSDNNWGSGALVLKRALDGALAML